MSPLVVALIITGIGMGLVFIAILLLWGLMELMMRVTGKQAMAEQAAEEAVEAETGAGETAVAVDVDQAALRRRAAAVAVAAALALKPAASSLPAELPGETVSAWQSVRRASQLSMRSSAYSRKERGIVR